ncbi:hypothetical protein M231_06208 [Tremella mesenterica]|uniref:Uncharacterized protein n=1 Tax=Tremella mesenterica TaxID=5217 RepID=A0A4Q1BCI7_TREME|nr:uncharacterized protein TREMEDRAFT_58144 [Tremella mesenterica DSM 1558]EIW72000.1 hypothetical protein TREMEDRAFT_58144 [Tremella mesenterica DSM 1558]RXK36549.1 hypothetical protein M231_06208 [Tremella mesenterica]
MSYNHMLPKKIDLKPKKRHGFQAVLFLLGCLLPPLAVAARFGIGSDFFLNCFLCICGYIPSHFHNFYIQNIRNNTNRARTPKWAIKYGLVDNSDRDRRKQKNQWAGKFEERNSHSALEGQELAEGEVGENYDADVLENPEARARKVNQGLWTGDDESYYNEDQAPNQREWHYPANFAGAVGDGRSKRRAKNVGSGDRWDRTRAARGDRPSSLSDVGESTYPPVAADEDIPEWGRDYGSKGRRSAKNKKKPQAKGHEWANGGQYAPEGQHGGENGIARQTSGSRNEVPAGNGRKVDVNWDHEF